MKQRHFFMTLAGMLLAALAALFFMRSDGQQDYAGLETREIKALPESVVAGLRKGDGLGYALTAELHGYPGPRHVLELSGQLNLTAEQTSRTQALFEQMKSEAVPLGQKRIEAERNLDAFFASGKKDAAALAALAHEAAVVDGTLRATHLKFHIAMLDILKPEQVEIYNTLRGYGGHSHSGH